LPLNLSPLWMLSGFYIPIGEDLNRYMLTVANLPEGRYELRAEGRLLGSWTAADLAKSINIASATADPWQPGGPWDAQAHALKVFTDMRDELVFARHGIHASLATHPQLELLRAKANAIERELIELQRQIAQPVPVRFSLRKTPAH
jgi:hypothetical protein